jgi:integrase
MASLSREPNGRRVVQIVGGDGRRRSVRLGKVSQREAETVRLHIERLDAAARTGHTPPAETAEWVRTLDERLHRRIAAVGLLPRRDASALASFIDAWINSRVDVKPATRTLWRQARDNLVDCFGADKLLRELNLGHGEEFRQYLLGRGLAEETTRKRCRIGKMFFAAALRRRLIAENPLAEVPTVGRGNPERLYFVSRAEADAVLASCPDVEWRMLFALSRWGGLRCPSEHLALRWGDVDWDRGRLTVHASKTEHHEGGGIRQAPLFPELRAVLMEGFAEAAEGAEFVITRYRSPAQNLRTRLQRIIKQAGLTPWPKLWQNLRSTRETELAETFPLHVVCAWIGNSRPVAMRHYLQVTDEHFERAVQNPVQQVAASGGTGSQPKPADSENREKCRDVRLHAAVCELLKAVGMGVTGLEQCQHTAGESRVGIGGGAESGAVAALVAALVQLLGGGQARSSER